MVVTTSSGVRRRWLAVLASAALLSVTPPLASQTGADALARKHFESGVAYLEESDYPSAIKAFTKAFELSKRPEILLNIATVHERAGDLPSAVAALKRYLEAAPGGAHAESVALRISNLERRIAEAPPAADAGSPAEPADAAAAIPTPDTAAPVPTAPPPPAQADSPAQQPNRIPAYVAFGVGGLAAAGAILTGVLAQSKHDDLQSSCSPNCSDDDVAAGENLALTSTILTGVAIAGVSIGAVLWFTGEPGSKRTERAGWDFGVGAAPRGARAQAVWRF